MTTARNTKPKIAKAEVSVPVPGLATRFIAIAGNSEKAPSLVSAGRRQVLEIYYQMYREHPTLRAAIEKIAKVSVSTGYQFQPEDTELPLPKDRAKELRTFFRKSNGNQLLKATYKDLLIYADAYWWIEKTRAGKPIRAKRLHPKYIDIQTAGARITKYRYGVITGDKAANEYEPEVIVHFRLDDPDNDLYGLSLLHSLQRVVATDLFAMDYNGQFFENSAQTGVIFNMKNTSPEEVERNRTWLELNYVGTRNAHKPLILEGDVEVSRTVSSPKEMEFVEGRRFAREEILSVMDVPLTKVSVTGDSNRSTAKEDDNGFREETIVPIQSVVEEEVSNTLILGMFGWDDIVFKHREVGRRDMIALTKMLAELERMGVFSVNEIRGEFGMSEVEGGNNRFIQTSAGLIPLQLIETVAERLVLGGLGTQYDPSAPSISDVPFDDEE
jgi:HK97 family phage portal protein